MPQFIRVSLAYIVNYFTFPGVVIHELSHKFFCEEAGVRVLKASYFRFGNPIGYIIHETPKSVRVAFLISIGPFIINTLVALGASYVSSYLESGGYWRWILLWVGFSAGVHAFPSDADIGNVAFGRRGVIGFLGYVATFPFLSIFRIANRLRPYGFDLVYAVGLVATGVMVLGGD